MNPELLALFFKAFSVGFLIAAPVGPIGLLTIQRTLNDGLFAGLLTGMGAATRPPPPLLMIVGVFLGSAAWWLILTGAVAWLRERFSHTVRLRISQASALLLAAFALWQWFTL